MVFSLIDERLRKIGTKSLRTEEFRAFKKAYGVAPARAARNGLYGENSLRAVEILANTGRLCLFYGKFKKAIEYFERARKIFERAAGCDQDAKLARENGYETLKIAVVKLAACLVNIGNVDFFRGNYETALGYYEKSESVLAARLRSDAPATERRILPP